MRKFEVQRTRDTLTWPTVHALAQAVGGRIGLEKTAPALVVQSGLHILERINAVNGDIFFAAAGVIGPRLDANGLARTTTALPS